MLEIRIKRMCRTPPYNRTEARARLTADFVLWASRASTPKTL
jgi:hypothetical protein